MIGMGRRHPSLAAGTTVSSERPADRGPAPRGADQAQAAEDLIRGVLRVGAVMRPIQLSAREHFRARPALSHLGLQHLIHELIPTASMDEVAAALGVPADVFRDLWEGRVVAVDLSPEPMVQLAQWLGLDLDGFAVLLQRDVARFGDRIADTTGFELLMSSWDTYRF